ncbi:malate synthase A [Demequina sp. SYSU T00192]|uniref:Malate synthase n=1 Tax=Demequina litoralis TaxID=3051660 RepID=A0ABT8G5H4_9MICO|nr:malate synthase A [Demequina sp. SYSU T00192]MDN4474380.1 malate synthase A [Demequina sp. SYSU T00192]
MCDTRIEIAGPMGDRYDEILTDEALAFLARLHRRFAGIRAELLHARQERAEAIAAGADPGFLPETRAIREDPAWAVAGPGPGLEDRRVEITGPTDRKMTINAMNSGARVWLADHEDANTPTWANMIEGQLNLADAIRGTIAHTSPDGREYCLGEERPTIVFRPRGWHLVEGHLLHVDPHGHRHPTSASLVDMALYVLTNAHALVASGSGPYLYLPKMESHLEARLWDQVLTLTEEHLGLEHGTIRVTMLIETLPAAFEMEEMLYELRDHCAGLNAGRWDYIFSMIKCYRARGADHLLPDRSAITMTVPFMRAYTELLVSTCHRRGAQAIGGMSAFIPNRRDPEATARALAQVAADKRREAGDGFDGSWVAHPGLVEVARTEFDAVLGDRPDQRDRRRDDVRVTAGDLLDTRIPGAQVTAAGVRANVAAGLRYVESWLRGTGAAAIDNLMEDVATAEISRSQLWQWIQLRVVTAEGRAVTAGWVADVIGEVVGGLERTPDDRFDDAAALLRELCLGEEFPTFLTLPAYSRYLHEAAPVPA